MSNTFLHKVQAERRVLAVVNRYTQRGSQLAGLSSSAIEDWQRRQGAVDTCEIVNRLRRLAAACQALSDRSHETFKSEERLAASDIELKCAELDEAMSKTFGSVSDRHWN